MGTHIQYRIAPSDGTAAYLTLDGQEAEEAMRKGAIVKSRLVEKYPGSSKMYTRSSWKEVKPAERIKEKAVRQMQYRIYLDFEQHFDTVNREKAVRHWHKGFRIYSRPVDLYPSGRVQAAGYWHEHPPKEHTRKEP